MSESGALLVSAWRLVQLAATPRLTDHQMLRAEDADPLWCRPTLLRGGMVPDEPWGPAGPLLRTMQWSNGAGPDAFGWELSARNGRLLARSSETFSDRSSAQTNFADLVTLATDLTLIVEHVGASSMWHWRLVDPRGSTLLRSPRRYERHGSCNRSGRLMLDLLARTTRV